jgi:hypothetical protein
MHRVSKTLLCLALTLCVSALLAQPGYAQTITTGSLTGVVMDQQKGVLPGATVTAVHVPTGTTYEAVTQADGRYQILNVRVGGPYTITVVMSGFRTETSKDAIVTLGNATEVSFTLPLATVTETVVVTGESPLIDTSRAGAAANISTDVKDLLPTISRSIPDIVRVDPMFNSMGSGAGDGASAVSVAGTSFRYNSLQIDGAVNNDLFGLASSAGAPGGTAETQPISLDAIQEIQLVVSPYDVRQGGFAGGGVNAITKSGSNNFHGSAFYFGRNQDWVGKLNEAYVLPGGSRAVSTFNEKQGGGTIGGPIARNKAFFFFTADYGRKNRPTGYSVSSTGQQFGYETEIDRVLNDLQTLYNYSPGSNPKDEFIRGTNNDK